jgi:benzoate/toluate 1,2-dioxygenase subunit alpha
MYEATIQRLQDSVQEDPAKGNFRCRRDIFTDPEFFEIEMRHIWEGNWVYLAHESQIPNKNDYITGFIGRPPIVISRDRNGHLHCFLNACSHRGAMICRHKRGNKTTYTCPFHGWTFNNTGKLLKAKDPDGAGYPDSFNKSGWLPRLVGALELRRDHQLAQGRHGGCRGQG